MFLQDLTGKNIRLRIPEPADAGLLYEWENDRNNWDSSDLPSSVTMQQILMFISESKHDIYLDGQLRLMIDISCGKSLPLTIGAIDLFEFDPVHLRAGVGILILEKFRQKGFATDALRTLIGHTFGALGLHQLFCNIPESNVASLKLFTGLGFSICGTKKEWNNKGDRWEDEHILQLING